MPRRAARTDANHAEVRDAFRALGFSVADTSALGKGFPDLVVAKDFRTAVVEVKDGDKPPSARKLTEDEAIFKALWKGEYLLVESLDDVMQVNKLWTGS